MGAISFLNSFAVGSMSMTSPLLSSRVVGESKLPIEERPTWPGSANVKNSFRSRSLRQSARVPVCVSVVMQTSTRAGMVS